MPTEIAVNAVWDADANVWVATSDDVPGLATEADTIEHLLERLRVMIPELLALNGRPVEAEVPFHLYTERADVARASKWRTIPRRSTRGSERWAVASRGRVRETMNLVQPGERSAFRGGQQDQVTPYGQCGAEAGRITQDILRNPALPAYRLKQAS
jgi:predicted RNase H-like HicB family nuclease